MTVNARNGLLKLTSRWNNEAVVNPKEILILNLMPTKETTEWQFLQRLRETRIDCTVTFLYPATHHFRHADGEKIKQHYACLDQIRQRCFDGLIITGAPVECLLFEAVDYWDEFKQIVEWAHDHVKSIIYECWAAQAGLWNDFGLTKQKLNHKLFGVYQGTASCQSALLKDLSTIKIPQSRHTKVELPKHLPAGLKVLAANQAIDPLIYQADEGHSIYITGHPEYSADTLDNEYRRDQKKGLAIQPPKNYYVDQNHLDIDYSWRQPGIQLYRNWLNGLAG
ncbi:homoserine O-acetyltransferase/O-succinyltransferase family protein [Limosilactobacillus mucosae]|uniref:homoserine O-acetyltransferase/O-succinyltransferase family protein n=1 Tax=Limosilactobacillus mucosae TaxID=97478 RepID=UPI000882C80A|nr:homoserine O-succinyltransferase [Limosilactobacillus mucosae]SDN39482.1 homoserine O-succinyltransferase [Limosilactobacillus mucosae]SEK92908.1 homoserine O-succinyltransferase [Limosilactobacillus mucosae]SFK15592.1 homoserine O-succinyltransferase [Limosilactobacillus mucosae]